MYKRILSMLLAVCMLFTMSATAFAADASLEKVCEQLDRMVEEETDAGAINFTVEEIPKAEMLGMDAYGIPAQDAYKILDRLEPAYTWKSPDGTLDIYYYSTTDAESLGIPDAQVFSEIAKINNDFTISYTTMNGEHVLADYYADGTFSFAINPKPETGEQVIEYISTRDTVRIYHFTEMQKEQFETDFRAAKEVEVHPTMFPFVEESGEKGTLKKTSSENCAALGEKVSVQARRLETRFKRNSVSWLSVAANITVAAFASKYMVAKTIALTALNAAGVALSGIGVSATIIEAFKFPDRCVYSAVLGYYGDVKDITTYKGKY